MWWRILLAKWLKKDVVLVVHGYDKYPRIVWTIGNAKLVKLCGQWNDLARGDAWRLEGYVYKHKA